VGTLKLIQAIHALKWRWQLGTVALAMWTLEFGKANLAIKSSQLGKIAEL
jgi:hypothetical protein